MEWSGLYSSSTNSNKSLDVEGAGTTDGTNVQQFTYNDVDQQKWVIQLSDDGRYYNIISKHNGLYLDATGGQSANGTNVQVWTGNPSIPAQKWGFVAWGEDDGQTISDGDYHIASALDLNQTLDVANDSKENNANIQLYSSLKNPNQVFHVTYLGRGYYKIFNANSGKCVEIPGGTGFSGSNVQQYASNGGNGQQWIIKDAGDGFYHIISKCNGMYLNVEAGQSKNGTNVQVYVGNQSAAQKWKFISADTTKPVISDIKVSDVSEKGYTVSCKVTDESGVDRVQFPTWTLANAQDDIDPNWTTSKKSAGIKNGDIYTFRVNASDHNNELGKYITHIYAWDKNGNLSNAKVDTVTLEKNSGAKISIIGCSAAIGEKAEVYIDLQNNPGIVGTTIGVQYDTSKLRLISCEDLGVLNDYQFSDLTQNPFLMNWEDPLATENNKSNGNIAKLCFEVLKDPGDAGIDLKLSVDTFYDVDIKDVLYTTENGKITKKAYKPGDVNEDGVVNSKDSILLRKYILGSKVTINKNAADVNKDGAINSKDSILLRKYILGAKVELK